ncbi:hypothetical protein VRRI112168_02900 [Vreelandella rituensis]|uniref:Uncharacterized protein n=1 Tax=Vreelandella rituensis TaxID=2282306 RepID=A0A368U9B1_9GAMM|nr:hypothetical protein [Halomonas rituensis]RCV93690.1 hypothetical protein DU506_00620 [Halomonas rituensis]
MDINQTRPVIVLNTLSTSGHCAWFTDDVFNGDSGCSGAGYASLVEAAEAAEDACEPNELMKCDVSDLSYLGDEYSQYSDTERGDKINQHRIPYADWIAAKR